MSGFSLVMLALMFVLVWWSLSQNTNGKQNYTYKEMKADIESGDVKEAVIAPDESGITGKVKITTKDNEQKSLYVVELAEVKELLDDSRHTEYVSTCLHHRRPALTTEAGRQSESILRLG